MTRIAYDPSALRDLAKLPARDADAVISAIDRYAAGRHRVLYRIEGSMIVVTAVVDRRDVYR